MKNNLSIILIFLLLFLFNISIGQVDVSLNSANGVSLTIDYSFFDDYTFNNDGKDEWTSQQFYLAYPDNLPDPTTLFGIANGACFSYVIRPTGSCAGRYIVSINDRNGDICAQNNSSSATMLTLTLTQPVTGTFTLLLPDDPCLQVLNFSNPAVNNFVDGNVLRDITPNSVTFVTTPVELTSFEATKEGEFQSKLNWETESELNNDYFEVQHSTNGKDFEVIGQVDGNGTTTTAQSYDFIHQAPVNGVNYYRLRQVDFDGAFEYSDIKTVEFDALSLNQFAIFPNPATDQLNVRTTSVIPSAVTLELYSKTGQLVKQQVFGENSNQFQLNVSDLPDGVYVLKTNTGLQVHEQRVVIHHK